MSGASGELPIGHISQIPEGEGRNYEVAGRRIAVFHTRGGAVYATQPNCPHRLGPLADGLTGDTMVICPLHDRTYDLRTGEGLNTDCVIAVYPTRVAEDGTILLVPVPNRPETAEDLATAA